MNFFILTIIIFTLSFILNIVMVTICFKQKILPKIIDIILLIFITFIYLFSIFFIVEPYFNIIK